jgi:hypothetical protein
MTKRCQGSTHSGTVGSSKFFSFQRKKIHFATSDRQEFHSSSFLGFNPEEGGLQFINTGVEADGTVS